MTHALRCEGAQNDDEEEEDEEASPIRSSFSVEDLLDEVEKISSVASSGKKVEIVVRLWKNGFTVNDEDLRSYSLEENQEFLEAIKRGELPLELEGRAEDEELEVNVEDMKDEVYVPKKKAFHPFTGRGYRLGSVAPRVVARSRSIHEDCSGPHLPAVELNEDLPVTSLQIWLADGHRLVQRFNLSHRISDVQDFVEQAQTTNDPFILTTSLPFRELRDEGQSLEEADLSNAVIVQRPINSQAPFGHS
ncbi:UBX domain-containing protein 2A-like isoform X2 [Xyrauchen texanus]|uniref:UBX domain-containing protein 2A-like isoform X2 n=1 Tax=Xyrauchen texanus TaxID=154827 RepID=UPI00224225D4|nr:UBX domain-containing protein 2A-like isoform X2 [Xyrauchen texanus]XP_051952074.1 UBX domain-containing protein 2A-like isoform X2 [Xyrauchen texanus]